MSQQGRREWSSNFKGSIAYPKIGRSLSKAPEAIQKLISRCQELEKRLRNLEEVIAGLDEKVKKYGALPDTVMEHLEEMYVFL